LTLRPLHARRPAPLQLRVPQRAGAAVGRGPPHVDALEAAAPARIAKGQLTDAEPRAGGLWRRSPRTSRRRTAGPPKAPATAAGRSPTSCASSAPPNGVAWTDKVARCGARSSPAATGYPADVAKGRLTRDQAKQQLERLEAVHDLYWRHGYAFDGTRDELRALGEII
jgi:hypothetical protein